MAFSKAFLPLLRRILFKLWQCGIHLIPPVRVGCPHIHLLVEPARIFQARSSDRGKLRGCVGIYHNRRTAVSAKAPVVLPPASLGESWKRSEPCETLNAFAGTITKDENGPPLDCWQSRQGQSKIARSRTRGTGFSGSGTRRAVRKVAPARARFYQTNPFCVFKTLYLSMRYKNKEPSRHRKRTHYKPTQTHFKAKRTHFELIRNPNEAIMCPIPSWPPLCAFSPWRLCVSKIKPN